MKINRISDTAINCIITEQDLREGGIDLHDLIDRKKEAMEFLRSVIVKAAFTENFKLQGEFTSMRVTVLSDQSVSLTLSHDPEEVMRIREINEVGSGELLSDVGKAVEWLLSHGSGNRNRPEDSSDGNGKVALFRFPSLHAVIAYCRQLRVPRGTVSDVYRDSKGEYYLLLRQGTAEDRIFTAQSVLAREFGSLITADGGKAGHFREHCDLVVEGDAIRFLSMLDETE